MTRNERNVEALAVLVALVTDVTGISSDADRPFVLRPVVTPEVARTIAEQIADRGVLVPSELTERDLDELLGDTRSSGPWVRHQLGRLARGEASWQRIVEAPPK